MTAQTISDLYPSKWLKAADLKPGGVVATIERTEIETFRKPNGTQEPALVIYFTKATKSLIANKTQLRAIEAVTGSERFVDWPGVRLQLTAGLAPNGKQTIVIHKPVDNL